MTSRGLPEVQGQIEGTLEYRSDLYDASTIDRIAGHLQAVLRAAVDDRHCNISRIPLLTATERRQVVETFNATSVALDPATFVVRFERQAAISAVRHAVASKVRASPTMSLIGAPISWQTICVRLPSAEAFMSVSV